jgi:hypothetical protein
MDCTPNSLSEPNNARANNMDSCSPHCTFLMHPYFITILLLSITTTGQHRDHSNYWNIVQRV